MYFLFPAGLNFSLGHDLYASVYFLYCFMNFVDHPLCISYQQPVFRTLYWQIVMVESLFN